MPFTFRFARLNQIMAFSVQRVTLSSLVKIHHMLPCPKASSQQQQHNCVHAQRMQIPVRVSMEYPQRQAYHSGLRTDQIATPLSFNTSIPQGPSEVSKPFR